MRIHDTDTAVYPYPDHGFGSSDNEYTFMSQIDSRSGLENNELTRRIFFSLCTRIADYAYYTRGLNADYIQRCVVTLYFARTRIQIMRLLYVIN